MARFGSASFDNLAQMCETQLSFFICQIQDLAPLCIKLRGPEKPAGKRASGHRQNMMAVFLLQPNKWPLTLSRCRVAPLKKKNLRPILCWRLLAGIERCLSCTAGGYDIIEPRQGQGKPGVNCQHKLFEPSPGPESIYRQAERYCNGEPNFKILPKARPLP